MRSEDRKKYVGKTCDYCEENQGVMKRSLHDFVAHEIDNLYDFFFFTTEAFPLAINVTARVFTLLKFQILYFVIIFYETVSAMVCDQAFGSLLVIERRKYAFCIIMKTLYRNMQNPADTTLPHRGQCS